MSWDAVKCACQRLSLIHLLSKLGVISSQSAHLSQMKKAPPVRLSLRKLFIAMLAVGPIAILPSPLLATVPVAAPFTITSGTATWTGSGSTGTINPSNRAVLTWGTTTQGDATTLTNFNIAAGETFNFSLPSGGAVLNRVTAGTNTTATVLHGITAGAAIDGTLLSNGQVVILSNGNIIVGAGAQIITASGLVLSTLAETDFNFTATGNLALGGASQGNIFLGTGTGVANSVGNLSAYAGTITSNNLTVSGDLILGQTGSGTGLVLTSASATAVSGNLTASSSNGAITQGAGALMVANGNTSLSSGTAAITLGTVTNDFGALTINTAGLAGSATIVDANIVTLGASNIGGDLSVTAGGKTNTTAISTTGTVVIGGNASLISASSSNSAVNIGNNSSIAGWASAATAGGAVTFNTTGNLTVGNITSNVTATTLAAGAAYPALAATATLVSGAVTAATLTAGSTSPIYNGNVTATFTSPVASATPVLTAAAVTGSTTLAGGSGYTAIPAVTIVGGGGTGATATATLTGDKVTGITITAGGSGYTSTPIFVIAPPVVGAVAAEGRAVRDGTTGLVTSIEVTNPGIGYGATVPTVSFTAVNTANNFASGNITATTTGALTTAAVGLSTSAAPAFALSSGLRSSQGIFLTGSSVTTNSVVSVTGNVNSTFTSKAGDVTFGDLAITANRITATATGGYIVQTAASVIATNNVTTGSTFNAGTGTVTLEGANLFSATAPVHVTASSATVRSANNLIVGTTNVTGNYSVRTEPAGIILPTTTRNVTLGFLDGSAATSLTVGGVLSVTATGPGWIRDNNDSSRNVFGGLNLQTGNATVAGGDITLDAATFPGSLFPSIRMGLINANTGLNGAGVTLSETTTLNLGNITGASLTASSFSGGIIDTGVVTLASGGVGTFTV
ncbi:MAG: hypothetical protein ABIQ12_04355, partial [Opitutaceae bacterium]